MPAGHRLALGERIAQSRLPEFCSAGCRVAWNTERPFVASGAAAGWYVNGYGLDYRAKEGSMRRVGVAPSDLTTTGYRVATVGDAMLLRPRIHPAGLTVAQARDAFCSSAKTHMLLLAAEGVLLGTLIPDDLAGEVAPGAAALTLAALEGRTVSPLASLAQTHLAMCRQGIRRLAVTDECGLLQGLLCLKRSLRGFCSDDGVAAMRLARLSRTPETGESLSSVRENR